jgi:hypothetical protein
MFLKIKEIRMVWYEKSMSISFLPNNAHICATKKHCWGGMKWGCRGGVIAYVILEPLTTKA